MPKIVIVNDGSGGIVLKCNPKDSLSTETYDLYTQGGKFVATIACRYYRGIYELGDGGEQRG